MSGAYDSDRLVARTAQDSISTAFNTEDKRRALWKIYRNALVEYANDAILVQTPRTLSDERATTPDDAEAKFVRVVGNAVQMLSQVIKVNRSAGSASDKIDVANDIRMIVGEKELWEYSSHQDPTLRRAVYNLVTICTSVMSRELNWQNISTCFIGKALHSNQLGSSRQFAEALLALTSTRPSIWTTDYHSKTAASKRLLQYLRKGSQRGPAEFWSDITALLKQVPLLNLSTVSEDGKLVPEGVVGLLEALRAGINSKEEPRQNLETAWKAYVDISFWTMDLLNEEQARVELLEKDVLPLVIQYVALDPKHNHWNTPSSFSAKISNSVLTSVLKRDMRSVFEDLWVGLCRSLSESMKLSLPESSKDFAKSQDNVIAQARRLFQLKTLILEAAPGDTNVADVFRRSDETLAVTAIEVLKTRHGKPYGAAAVLETITSAGQSAPQTVLLFLRSDALNLLASPSAEYFVSMFLHTHQDLTQVLPKLIETAKSTNSSRGLARLLGGISGGELAENPAIEPFTLERIASRLDSDNAQQIVRSLLYNHKLASTALHKNCCQKLLDQLSLDTEIQQQHATLRFLLNLLNNRTSNVSLFMGDMGSSLLTKLLLLSDSEDAGTAELASSLLAKIKTAPAGTSSTSASSAAIISDQLSGKGEPLSIFVLIDLAKDHYCSTSQQADVVRPLLPNAEQWLHALGEHLSDRPPLSLSITSPLRGLIFMINPVHAANATQFRDPEGFSSLFRLVLYTSRIMLDTDVSARPSEEQLEVLYYHYPLALQVINEKLTMEKANDAWHNSSNVIIGEAADVLSQGNSLVQRWIEEGKILTVWMGTIRSTDTLDPRSYYHSLAFTHIASRFIDEHGSTAITAAFEAEIEELHRSDQVVRSASLIAVCRDHFISSQQGRKVLNELVAAVTGSNLPSTSDLQLRPFVLLDVLLSGSSEPLENLPSQRQTFLMQSLVRTLSSERAGLAARTLATKILEPVVVAIKNLYGDHWEQILQSLVAVLQNGSDLNEDLPLLHASLRLYGRLRSLAKSDDANEDLAEAWNAGQHSLEDGLLNCLHSFDQATDTIDQPRRLTAELLQRRLLQVTPLHGTNLYPFLSSIEDPVRGAAYDLLHRSIPIEQEQISLDIALEKRAAHLPPELLTSLSDVPQAAGSGTSKRRSYLLCWDLVYDHFPKASYKLQEFYAADIKEKAVLGGLLDLICEICRITSSRPLDASKTDVKVFDLGTSETDEQEEQRLAMHLYYCCLLYLPGLTRSWFIEQKNRVKSPLESWTQRYFSPTLMSAAAATVNDWAKALPQEDGESTLTVKSSLAGSETVASIAVDPESPPISLAILLPKSYPLESPTVSSRTRVGVSEKNWQSWLRTIQIIIFSTGSIIEGLMAFRHNVQGALKGQSECAICYCIIGTDMQTPNKRCGTCRNNFHGACLFRWFRSSNSSSCPVCRNNFNYA